MGRIVVTALLLALSGAGLAQNEAGLRFQQIYEAEWEFRLRESPLMATGVGDHRFDDRLARHRPEDRQRRYTYWRGVLQQLDALDSTAMSSADQINLAVFRRQIRSFVDDFENHGQLLVFNSDWGFYISLARLPNEVPLQTQAHLNNYLDRLAQIPAVIDDYIVIMREGLAIGMTQPQVILEGRDEPIRLQVVDEVRQSGFYAPLLALPDTIDDTAAGLLRARARALIMDGVVPAYARLLKFFNTDYSAGARTTLGASRLPDGERFYSDQIRHYTTLTLSAQEIHDIGRKEVTRIRGEMDAIIEEVEFSGDFAAFIQFLRTDPQFFASTPKELMMHAMYIAKRMDGKLPALFRHLPRQPYGVEPVPDEIAPFFTGGRYVGAPIESTRPGLYWVNTWQLESRTLYTLPALTLHEAVPGHHLQGALAQELAEQPPFRRNDYISAYGEGWGLYAEFLGIEAGIYETPYENFGRLTYEMWRACRLVIDTGIHAFDWDRQRAIDYLASNTALSLHEVTTEIDRYISWPGQALSYKLGELKIKELRSRTATALGPGFDLREFHDLVLAQGSVPLSILEQAVDRYIEEQQ